MRIECEHMKPAISPSVEVKHRIYLIDDHPLVVQGVTELVNAEHDLNMVGSTSEWTEALTQIPELPTLIYRFIRGRWKTSLPACVAKPARDRAL